jgi:hypothetical protein
MRKKRAKDVGCVYFFTGFPRFIASMLLEELIAKWAPEKIYILVLPNMKDKVITEKERICFANYFPQESYYREHRHDNTKQLSIR